MSDFPLTGTGRLAETIDEVEDALLSRWPETRLEPSLDRIEAFTDLQITWIGSESGEIAISDEFDLAVSLSEEEGSDE